MKCVLLVALLPSDSGTLSTKTGLKVFFSFYGLILDYEILQDSNLNLSFLKHSSFNVLYEWNTEKWDIVNNSKKICYKKCWSNGFLCHVGIQLDFRVSMVKFNFLWLISRILLEKKTKQNQQERRKEGKTKTKQTSKRICLMSQKEVKIMAPKPNVYAVIPASGEGERFGSKIPKQVRHFHFLLPTC